jgi:hypothetical protein
MTQGWSKELLATRDWLRGEDDYQFGKNMTTHNADPASSMSYILGTEIENKWYRFQLFNSTAKSDGDSKLLLQASQQILKACGAARGALVWDYVTQGCSVDEGSKYTFVDLAEHFDAQSPQAIQANVPKLELPIDAAISPYELVPKDVKSVFTQLASLVATHLYDLGSNTGSLILPKPGLPSGEIEPWVQ